MRNRPAFYAALLACAGLAHAAPINLEPRQTQPLTCVSAFVSAASFAVPAELNATSFTASLIGGAGGAGGAYGAGGGGGSSAIVFMYANGTAGRVYAAGGNGGDACVSSYCQRHLPTPGLRTSVAGLALLPGSTVTVTVGGGGGGGAGGDNGNNTYCDPYYAQYDCFYQGGGGAAGAYGGSGGDAVDTQHGGSGGESHGAETGGPGAGKAQGGTAAAGGMGAPLPDMSYNPYANTGAMGAQGAIGLAGGAGLAYVSQAGAGGGFGGGGSGGDDMYAYGQCTGGSDGGDGEGPKPGKGARSFPNPTGLGLPNEAGSAPQVYSTGGNAGYVVIGYESPDGVSCPLYSQV
ncbi:hypothetical protein DFJ74DRAFT_767822 [Hyaloraphidium curvatum]|nr:hypothetical protein DFJ74DRAFT_767822 [Hyaloraphidium curvatum]